MALTDAMVALYSTTLAAATSSVTIAGIPTTGYRDLRLVITTQQNVTTAKQAKVRFNGDAANYTLVYADGYSTTTTSGTDTKIAFAYAYSGTAANEVLSGFMDIFDYATDKHKTVLVRGGGSTSVSMYAGRWASTAAITSIEITADTGGNWSAGSTFELFGIKA
jgi:hypothetical protein